MNFAINMPEDMRNLIQALTQETTADNDNDIYDDEWEIVYVNE